MPARTLRQPRLAAPVLLHLAVSCAEPLASALGSRLDAVGPAVNVAAGHQCNFWL